MKHKTSTTQPEATLGYRLNHFMLRIRDPKESLHFYTELMGLQSVFTRDVGPITIYYLGYPQSAEHQADSAAYARDTSPHEVLTQTLGLLELCHFHGSEKLPRSSICSGAQPPHLGFNHLGFTVPDVKTAVARLRDAGVKIVKDLDEGVNDLVPVTKWEKAELGVATQEASRGFIQILDQIAMIEDPVNLHQFWWLKANMWADGAFRTVT